jgi:hypothetical protein
MIDELVRMLELQPHPEGGYYRETYRASAVLETPRGRRHAGTAIYYLLPKATFAAFHRVTSDEVWHHYDGGPLALHLVDRRATTRGGCSDGTSPAASTPRWW